VRPGLLVDPPCSAPLRPGATPVLPAEDAGVVPVPTAALGTVGAGGWGGGPEVPGPDGGDTFDGPAGTGRRSRFGRGALSRPRDLSRSPGLAPGTVDAAAPRWPGGRAALLAAAASIRAGNAGGDDRGWA
jgi:hypothetical protein